MDYVRNRYKTVYIPNQEGPDGSFPLELARTQALWLFAFQSRRHGTICQILSTDQDDLGTGQQQMAVGSRRRSPTCIRYIAQQGELAEAARRDVFRQWPMRHAALLFGGLALNHDGYVETWKRLPADSEVEEVIRNFFIRQPVLWVSR